MLTPIRLHRTRGERFRRWRLLVAWPRVASWDGAVTALIGCGVAFVVWVVGRVFGWA